jgi:hypothetical protein
MAIELAKVDAIIGKHGADRRALISLLLDIQDEFYYLPPEALERVAEKVGVPDIQVYQAARFYKAFSLKPRGKHTCLVCLGTACRSWRRAHRRTDRATTPHPARRNHRGSAIHTPDGQLPGVLRVRTCGGGGWDLPWQYGRKQDRTGTQKVPGP